MSSHWYVGDADGAHFNWSKEPTYRCPLAEAAADEPTDELEAAAALLGVGVDRLARIITRAHTGGYGYRRRVEDKLTDECTGCGRKMRRLGFRAWIDELVPEGEGGELEGVSRALNRGLGFGPARRTVRVTWHKTKKEAEAWARHECKRAKAAA